MTEKTLVVTSGESAAGTGFQISFEMLRKPVKLEFPRSEVADVRTTACVGVG
jgi:hypothetical protein